MTKITRDDVVFFWKTRHPFSQWHPSKFIIEGITYNRAEQYMMAHKALLFGDDEHYRKIMESNDPRTQKQLGRKIRGFDQDKWESECERIVFDANLAKFSQNQELLNFRLETGDKMIVEASPHDEIWGIGIDENDPDVLDMEKWGQNKLGEILIRVREILRKKKNI